MNDEGWRTQKPLTPSLYPDFTQELVISADVLSRLARTDWSSRRQTSTRRSGQVVLVDGVATGGLSFPVPILGRSVEAA
jgi:hypothetical protein